MATKHTLKLIFVSFLFLCHNLDVTVVALVQNSPRKSFKPGSIEPEESENRVERGTVVKAMRLGGKSGGENGNVVQASGGVIPVYAAAGAAKNKHHKYGHHKGGCIKCKVMESPLLTLFAFTALLL